MSDEAPAEVSNKSEAVAIQTAKKSSNKTLFIVLGVLAAFLIIPGILLAIGLAVFGSKISDKVAEKGVESVISSASGGKVDVNSKDGSFTVKGKDGDSSISIGGTNQKLPDDFPKSDIPYLSEAGVTSVFTSSSGGKKSWSVSTIVDKSFTEAQKYFEGKIKEPDYTDVASFGSSGSQLISGKNAKFSVTVTISEGKDGEKTAVQYIVSQE